MTETIFEFELKRPTVAEMRDAAKSVGAWEDDPIPVVIAADGVRYYPTQPESVGEDDLMDALEVVVAERPIIR